MYTEGVFPVEACECVCVGVWARIIAAAPTTRAFIRFEVLNEVNKYIGVGVSYDTTRV